MIIQRHIPNEVSFQDFQKELKDELNRKWNKEQGFHQSTHYLDRFLRLRCAPDLLGNKLFPSNPSKEITESMGAYFAVENNLLPKYALSDPSITVIVVGDGATPRTRALFACRTAWNVFSVDPNLNMDRDFKIARLTKVGKRIEELYQIGISCPGKAVVVNVHSHACLQTSVDRIQATQIAVVAIPCCKPQLLNQKPDISYIDEFIWSPEQAVYVWKDYKNE